MSGSLGLYIHIPYCRSKCVYCDFYSIPTATGGDGEKASKAVRRFDRYIDALLLQMEDYSAAARSRVVDTVYFGGGTPSLLSADQISLLLRGVRSCFRLARGAEVTMEVNPATVTPRTLRAYRRAGVNRLSIGIQSLSDAELSAAGRAHNAEDALDAFDMARRAGFANISVDLIYGLPGQTAASFASSVEGIIALAPEHVSLYALKTEEGTPLADSVAAGLVTLPGEDEVCDMYFSAIKTLEAAGIEQYEISNFALPGYESRHNSRYWDGSEYLGFGPGAHSLFAGQRFAFKRDASLYIAAMEDGAHVYDIVEECSPVTKKVLRDEFIMLSLRTTRGLDSAEFRRRFGEDFAQEFAEFLPVYIENGYMERLGDRYALTPKGMYVSNYIISALLAG